MYQFLLLILFAPPLILSVLPQDVAETEKTLSPFFWIANSTSVTKLPLNATFANVSIQGVIAQVKITQVYQNRGEIPIEALYIFPASSSAVVYGMQMLVNGRLVVGRILTKEQAREQYEIAKNEGKTASLLEMQRPNVYAMSVANILPEDIIRVEIFYTELLVPLDSVYSFNYPATMGPRYTGEGGEELQQPDFTVESTYTFGLDLQIHAGMDIASIDSPTHEFVITMLDSQNYHMVLSANNTNSGSRDVLINYVLSGDTILTGILIYDGEMDDGYGGPFRLRDGSDQIFWDTDPIKNENFFLVMIQPPSIKHITEPPTREYIFILDTSGSMEGSAEKISHNIMYSLIATLRSSRDYFNILAFAGGSTVFEDRSVLATQDMLQKAISFVKSQRSGGGTNMLDAVKRGLSITPPNDNRGIARTYIILTDGYISVEKEVFELILSNLKDANFFAVSIGVSPNRYLTQGIARVGRGEEFWVKDDVDGAAMVPRFVELANFPVLTSVKVDFAPNWNVYDINPAPGILLAQRPILVSGKWSGSFPSGQLLKATGLDAAGNVWQSSLLSDKLFNDPIQTRSLKYLWAGEIINDARYSSSYDEANTTILPIALKYSILTEYTSFLAVDTIIRTNVTNDDLLKVTQPLPLPEGFVDFTNTDLEQHEVSTESKTVSYSFHPSSSASYMVNTIMIVTFLCVLLIVY